MKRIVCFKRKALITVSLLLFIAAVYAQTPGEPKLSIDIQKERPVIESRDALYSKYLLQGDSISIAAMYTSDGMMLGGQKGPEILSSIGRWIRNNIKNDSRHVTFKLNTLNADGELLIETGTAESRNDAGELKYSFQYLVVWKKENDVWKIYRDVPL